MKVIVGLYEKMLSEEIMGKHTRLHDENFTYFREKVEALPYEGTVTTVIYHNKGIGGIARRLHIDNPDAIKAVKAIEEKYLANRYICSSLILPESLLNKLPVLPS